MVGTLTPTQVRSRGRGISKIRAVFTSDASGDVTVGDIGTVYGRLVAVGYKPGDLATGVDLTVTDKQTGASIIVLTNAGTAARWFRPTAVITDNVGAAVTAAATATGVDRDIYVAGTLRLLVAGAGATKTGELFLIFDEAAA